MSDTKLLRVEDAATRLSTSRSKAYQLVATGELPSIRLGRRGVRVPEAALNEWIRANTSGGNQAA